MDWCGRKNYNFKVIELDGAPLPIIHLHDTNCAYWCLIHAFFQLLNENWRTYSSWYGQIYIYIFNLAENCFNAFLHLYQLQNMNLWFWGILEQVLSIFSVMQITKKNRCLSKSKTSSWENVISTWMDTFQNFSMAIARIN